MFRYISLLKHSRWLSYFPRYLSTTNESLLKNFDRKIFDHLSTRRLELFNGNKDEMLNHIRLEIESLLKTPSITNYLMKLNSKYSKKTFSQNLTFQQLNDILFFAYENNLKLNFLTTNLVQCVSSSRNENLNSNLFIEIINLFVLHQQKYYDRKTKNPNKILENFINHLEFNLTNHQIDQLLLNDLSLLCSAMFRLQIPLKNPYLLENIGKYLINDEIKKNLSAVDKQNFLKILTLSNYGRMNIAHALSNRFNQSFQVNKQSNFDKFSYEIVRMTMRIGMYFLMFHCYSKEFFENCLKLIEFQSNASTQNYRPKDIIQIMNTLIYMGYQRRPNEKYLNLISIYDQMKQFDQKPERLVDVLAPLAMIGCFPEEFLEKLFLKENLNRLTESRMKEKLFFIAQSYKLLCSPQRSLLDQNYLDSLPHHIFGSWEIEKRKRPYFSIVIQRLLECVPSRFYVKSAFLLKHFKSPDIIICLNDEQQPQTISNDMKKSVGFFDENKNDCSMYALEVLSKEEICINEPLQPIGIFYSKARQLQKLGYIPVIVYPNDTLHEVKTAEEVYQWIIQRAKTTELLLNAN